MRNKGRPHWGRVGLKLYRYCSGRRRKHLRNCACIIDFEDGTRSGKVKACREIAETATKCQSRVVDPQGYTMWLHLTSQFVDMLACMTTFRSDSGVYFLCMASSTCCLRMGRPRNGHLGLQLLWSIYNVRDSGHCRALVCTASILWLLGGCKFEVPSIRCVPEVYSQPVGARCFQARQVYRVQQA